VNPSRLGTGKPRYYLCGSAIARLLGATFARQMETMILNERLSQHFYATGAIPKITFYRSQKGALTHFLEETADALVAVLIIDEERLNPVSFRRLHAVQEKALRKSVKKQVQLVALAPVDKRIRLEGVDIFPWESIA
jgi:hypothetical protein